MLYGMCALCNVFKIRPRPLQDNGFENESQYEFSFKKVNGDHENDHSELMGCTLGHSQTPQKQSVDREQ